MLFKEYSALHGEDLSRTDSVWCGDAEVTSEIGAWAPICNALSHMVTRTLPGVVAGGCWVVEPGLHAAGCAEPQEPHSFSLE